MEAIETRELLGLIIALIAVTGGLGIGALAIKITVAEEMKKQIAAIEARNKERLALIERGLDPSIADRKKSPNTLGPFFWGLLLIGISLGVLAGYVLSYSGVGDRAIMMNTMAMLFGGIALLIYYKNRSKREDVEKAG